MESAIIGERRRSAISLFLFLSGRDRYPGSQGAPI
jgi:hypothetical protein